MCVYNIQKIFAVTVLSISRIPIYCSASASIYCSFTSRVQNYRRSLFSNRKKANYLNLCHGVKSRASIIVARKASDVCRAKYSCERERERTPLTLHIRLLYRVSRLEVVKFIARWSRGQNEEELEIGSTIFTSEGARFVTRSR